MARRGKIARLPEEIRNELNRRLRDGEQGGTLLAWLNGLPQTVEVMARDFGGIAISKQNLSQWRGGGLTEARARQETLEEVRKLVFDGKEITGLTDGKLTEHLSTVLAARYAAAIAKWDGVMTEEFRQELRTLRGLCQEIVALRREDHSEVRLKMEQGCREWQWEKSAAKMVNQFGRWLSDEGAQVTPSQG